MNQNQLEKRPYIEEDEIDLIELWKNLLEDKKQIIAYTLGVVVLATAYVFSITPTFQSKAYLLPPALETIHELNQLELLLGNQNNHSQESIFRQFLQNLDSRSLKTELFYEQNLVLLYNKDYNNLSGEQQIKAFNMAFDQFSKDFNIILPKKNSGTSLVTVDLSLQASPNKIPLLLKIYLDKVNQKTTQNLIDNINNKQAIAMNQLELKINSSRRIAESKRMDRVIILNEAIQIARKLGISEIKEVGANIHFSLSREESFKLFYIGYKALEAEKYILKSRKSDDPFIKSLRGNQEKHDLINRLVINKERISAVKIDQAPAIAIKTEPNKALILAMSGILGLMLGIFISLIRRAIKSQNATNS